MRKARPRAGEKAVVLGREGQRQVTQAPHPWHGAAVPTGPLTIGLSYKLDLCRYNLGEVLKMRASWVRVGPNPVTSVRIRDRGGNTHRRSLPRDDDSGGKGPTDGPLRSVASGPHASPPPCGAAAQAPGLCAGVTATPGSSRRTSGDPRVGVPHKLQLMRPLPALAPPLACSSTPGKGQSSGAAPEMGIPGRLLPRDPRKERAVHLTW